MTSPIIIGHRGLGAGDIENTRMVFREAVRLGIDMVELDVMATSDNQLVVFHDRNLARMTFNPKKIKDITLEELKKEVLPFNQKILTLDEFLEEFDGKIGFNIEIKGHKIEEQVFERIKNIKSKLFVTSLKKETIVRFAKVSKKKRDFPIGVIFYPDRVPPIPYYWDLVVVTPLSYLKDRDLLFHSFLRRKNKMIILGVDFLEDSQLDPLLKYVPNDFDGIITNYPLRWKRAKEKIERKEVIPKKSNGMGIYKFFKKSKVNEYYSYR